MRTWDEEADPMQVLAGMVGSKPAAGIPAEQPKAPAADDQ
jgi:hypothetical protein